MFVKVSANKNTFIIILSHCFILYYNNSDHSNVELEAINVLLKSEMWDNVIAVLKEMKSKVLYLISSEGLAKY